ncbi:hypothetical protein LWI28_016220 [Acer negundo]|uniref:non-specific serine/threonine protein kinase n=1 Tax=Acer negundo TaxID=4023 RepID=A0AAD5JFU8_ACENE|nr:hypothetical protein LWI28_016220 [Acer negundo]
MLKEVVKDTGTSEKVQTLIFMGCNRARCIWVLFLTFDLFGSLHALETITGTQFIADDENRSLVSSDGNFKLGFFSPAKSQAHYVGIWFNKISEQKVVWVANRETPIRNSSGIFKIGGDGNLAVFCCNQSSPLWSTNVSVPAQTSAAKLLDSGNLVLVAKETIIWQSFDYPTDTLLAGMKFGYNRKTGLNRILTSWKSIDDPTPGEFSSGFDPHGIPQIFLYKNLVPHWRSGIWNGRILNGMLDVGSRKDDFSDQIDFVNVTFVSKDNEIYIKFAPKKVDVFSIVVMESMGFLNRLIWHESQRWVKVQVTPEDMCDEYMRCGANAICNEDAFPHCACLPGFERLYPQDWYLKCQETRKEGCGKGDGEGFVRLEGVKFPDARYSTLYSNMSLEECERECLKSCNCTGYANVYVDEMGRDCIAWYGKLQDMRHFKSGQDFYLRVDAVELAANAQKNTKVHVLTTKSTLVFIIVPLVETLLSALCFSYFWRRNAKRNKGKKKQQRRQMLLFDSERSLSNYRDSSNANSSASESGDIEITFFELNTVIAATENFSSANKLGRGGFGPVFKGQLANGQEIAVKRLSNNSGQGFDPHSIPQFFLYKNSVPHWRSGPWNGHILNGLPEVGGHKDYFSDQIDLINITFVSNDNEIYLKYSPKKGAVFSIVVLETMGLLKRLIWHESQRWVKVQVVLQDLCDEYMRCGANAICSEDTLAHCACLPGFDRLYPQDWYLKCQETRKEACGKGDGEGFVRLEGVKFPDARNSTLYSNMTLEECGRESLKSCNCTGYANVYVDELGRGCIAWYGELRDMRRYKSGQDFYLRVDAVELAADAQKNASTRSSNKKYACILIVPIVVETLLASLCFYYMWRRNAKRKGQKQKQKQQLHQNKLVLDSARSLSPIAVVKVGVQN